MQSTGKEIYAALLTPFDRELALDTRLLASHARDVLGSGCTGVSPFGTTGEATSLTVAERMHGLEALLDGGLPPAKLMPGVGCASVADSVALAKHALSLGVTDVLALPPFYYKEPSDDGIFAAYAYVIDRVADARLRVYLYHIPQFSAIPLSLGLVERLRAAYPRTVVGIKDSSADRHDLRAFCAIEGFRVFVGAERLLSTAIAARAAGTICALANVDAPTVKAVCDGDAAQAQTRIDRELDVVDRFGFIPAYKAILAERGTPEWRAVRPPLVALGDDRRRAASAAFDGLAVA